MTVFLCILALLAIWTEIKVSSDWSGWVPIVLFALKVVMVLGLVYFALESYRL